MVGNARLHLRPLVRRGRALKSALEQRRRSRLRLGRELEIFAPSSAGGFRDVEQLTLESANHTIPALASLLSGAGGLQEPVIEDVDDFCSSYAGRTAAVALGNLFQKYGSDKAVPHGYELAYGSIMSGLDQCRLVLEVGLGTNNTDVVSNMGAAGVPGASVRAFRDFLPQAHIYGADIDHRILFAEERITTIHCDQTSPDSLASLASQLPKGFDLIVDDGLHSPHANINTLAISLPLLRVGGWSVTEDIHGSHLPIWQLVSMLLEGEQFECHLLRARQAFLFAVKRVGQPI